MADKLIQALDIVNGWRYQTTSQKNFKKDEEKIYNENYYDSNRKINKNQSNQDQNLKDKNTRDDIDAYYQYINRKDMANIKDLDRQIERTEHDILNIKKNMEKLNKETFIGGDANYRHESNMKYKKPTEDDIKAYNRALYQTTSKQYGNYYYN